LRCSDTAPFLLDFSRSEGTVTSSSNNWRLGISRRDCAARSRREERVVAGNANCSYHRTRDESARWQIRDEVACVLGSPSVTKWSDLRPTWSTSTEAPSRRVLSAVGSTGTAVQRIQLPTNPLFDLLIGKLNSIAPNTDISKYWRKI